MSQPTRQPSGHECPPPSDPAPQPHPPGAGDTCQDLPTTTPPTLEKPEKCPEPADCKCPPPPGTTSTCLEDLIAAQTAQIAAADKAKAFKADLEALLAKAKA